MVSLLNAGSEAIERDPLFASREDAFKAQDDEDYETTKPPACGDCPFANRRYGWEEPPRISQITGEVIPTDVLIIIPRPTLADVGLDDFADRPPSDITRYQQPFGWHVRWGTEGLKGSKSWHIYRRVIRGFLAEHSRLYPQDDLTIRTIFAVPCRGKGDTPAKVAKYCGQHYLTHKIREYKAKTVLALGNTTAKALDIKFKKMLDLRGTIQHHEDLQVRTPVVFTNDADYYFFPSQDYKCLDIFVKDLEKAVSIARTGRVPQIDHVEFKKKLDFPESAIEIELLMSELLDRYEEKPFTLAFDLETTGLWHWYDEAHSKRLDTIHGIDVEKCPEKGHYPARIVAISLAWGEDKAAAFLTEKFTEKTWGMLEKLMGSSIPKVAHNAKFDMTYLLGVKGIRVNNLRADTLLNAHLVDENRAGYVHGEYSLKKLVWDYLPEFGGYEHLGGVYQNIGRLHLMSPDELKEMLYYAALDAVVTWRIHRIQFYQLNDVAVDSMPASKVKHSRRYKFSRTKLIRASYAISELETTGLRLDLPHLQKMQKTLRTLAAREEGSVNNALTMLGETSLNIGSPKQLERLLYEKLNLPVTKKTRKGARSTSAEVLTGLMEHDKSGLVKSIIHMRRLGKMADFLKQWQDLAKDGRIYPFINLDGTVTGRLSSSKPNIQQVPKADKFEELAKIYKLPEDFFNLKTCFIPDDGHVMIAADFSQMEIRVLAAYCGGGALSNILNTEGGLDLHSQITSQVHDIEYDLIETARHDKTHARHKELAKLRGNTKATTFTITYGGTEYTLWERDGLPKEEGKALFKLFFKQFPEVQTYIDQSHNMAREYHWVDTMFHRRRHFPILRYTKYNRALRQAQNSRIQSTASDVCLMAVIDLNERLKEIGGRVIITVHDSIVAQVPRDKLKEGLRLYKQVMLDEPQENYKWLTVPLAIDLEVGHSWGDMVRVPIDEEEWDGALKDL